MNESILELEQQDIELQLREIELKRRSIEIEREKLEQEEKDNVSKVFMKPQHVNAHCVSYPERDLYLHYSKSTRENLMTIVNINSKGAVMIKGCNDSEILAKKYNMRSLSWIKSNLSKWSTKQKMESHFWESIARKYSKCFLEDDSISRTTIEKLCYLIDSGKMNYWFNKWEAIKAFDGQSQLKIQ